MTNEIEMISEEMSHAGEKGRNNEAILVRFLRQFLPTRYTVSTGKVIAVGGAESGQVDIVIHDRFETPAFKESHAWSLVPIESVHAVISVKTSISKAELRDAMTSLASVRALPRNAATLEIGGKRSPVGEGQVLRPRAFVFAYRSSWASVESAKKAFEALLPQFEDDVRPNGVCVLNQVFFVRRQYTAQVREYREHMLLHFFLFLVKAMDSRPRYRADLSRYITEDYDQSSKGA